ncbi:hypothetical protein OSB04_004780 [Centaurea solstitialis]|uniref:Uncharacterized protein n=1 Tax=Centaurea solstitialis TaxID=347529 RepID=A0AA38TER2_9ASTR|nr:hypothetical protein OSB04_004780 [Centaurea solstitialis]
MNLLQHNHKACGVAVRPVRNVDGIPFTPGNGIKITRNGKESMELGATWQNRWKGFTQPYVPPPPQLGGFHPPPPPTTPLFHHSTTRRIRIQCNDTPPYPLSLFSKKHQNKRQCVVTPTKLPLALVDDCDDLIIDPELLKALDIMIATLHCHHHHHHQGLGTYQWLSLWDRRLTDCIN